MKLQSSFLLLIATITIGISNASSDTPGIIWTSTGGGWRSMAASTAYAQVFSNLGMLGGDDDSDTTTSKISSVATTSGRKVNLLDRFICGFATSFELGLPLFDCFAIHVYANRSYDTSLHLHKCNDAHLQFLVVGSILL